LSTERLRGAQRLALASAIVLGAYATAGCTSTASAPRATAAPAAPPKLATTKVEEPTFALVLSAPEEVVVGAKVRAELSIEGRGEYHVNHEYPIEITLRAPPEVALASSALGSAHAKQLVPERARFELELTCRAPGSHRIDAHVDFALCTEQACTPEARDIALTVRARD
jgi:hypothetical protein